MKRCVESLNACCLSEESQFEKSIYSMIPTIWHSGKKSETVKWPVVFLGVKGKRWTEHRNF